MNKEAKALVKNTFSSLQGAKVDIASTDLIPVPQDNGYAWLQGMQPNPNLNLNLSPNPITIPNPKPILIQALRVTGEMCKASVRVKH